MIVNSPNNKTLNFFAVLPVVLQRNINITKQKTHKQNGGLSKQDLGMMNENNHICCHVQQTEFCLLLRLSAKKPTTWSAAKLRSRPEKSMGRLQGLNPYLSSTPDPDKMQGTSEFSGQAGTFRYSPQIILIMYSLKVLKLEIQTNKNLKQQPLYLLHELF